MHGVRRAASLSLLALLFATWAGGDPAPRESGRFAVANLKARDIEAAGAKAGPQNFAITEDARGVLYFASGWRVGAKELLPTERVSCVSLV